MVDKGHCKVNVDTDMVALKLSRFHESGLNATEDSKQIIAADGRSYGVGWHLDALEENPYDLVLPNGTKLGHRKLKVGLF